jgi:thymidine phosphorylase
MRTEDPLLGVVVRLDMDDCPIGTIVKTPTGRIGIVTKHCGAQSRKDMFQRVVIQFKKPRGDTVTLQPHLLTIIKRSEATNDGE